jgi:hypothetical protein
VWLQIEDDLHVCEAFVGFYGVRIQTRMTVVRLGDGSLFVHSPTALDAATRRELDRLGPVAHVVAPNKIHNQFIAAFRAAYPEAAFHAPPGLPERRPDLRFDDVLGSDPRTEWADELDQALTAGNCFFVEAIFLHRRSGSLIVGDLVENLDRRHTSAVGALLVRLLGGYGRPRASPEFRMYTDDAEAARTALARVRGWKFRRIVLAHGEMIETDAPAVFASVVDELLETAATRRPWLRSLARRVARLQ